MSWRKMRTRKTWKQPYRGSRRFDRTCRNHGTCPWCRDSRLRYRRVHNDIARSQEAEAA